MQLDEARRRHDTIAFKMVTACAYEPDPFPTPKENSLAPWPKRARVQKHAAATGAVVWLQKAVHIMICMRIF